MFFYYCIKIILFYIKRNLFVQIISDFCADAGLVSVFLLDEVRKYNPDFDVWIEEHKWCCTKIEDFDGDIEITHREIEYDGDIENEVSVIGKGNINFFTSQSGY